MTALYTTNFHDVDICVSDQRGLSVRIVVAVSAIFCCMIIPTLSVALKFAPQYSMFGCFVTGGGSGKNTLLPTSFVTNRWQLLPFSVRLQGMLCSITSLRSCVIWATVSVIRRVSSANRKAGHSAPGGSVRVCVCMCSTRS